MVHRTHHTSWLVTHSLSQHARRKNKLYEKKYESCASAQGEECEKVSVKQAGCKAGRTKAGRPWTLDFEPVKTHLSLQRSDSDRGWVFM